MPGDHDLKILIVQEKSSAPNVVEKKLRDAGYGRIVTVEPGIPFEHLVDLSPDLALLGSSLTPELVNETIRKLKINDILVPVLVMNTAEKQEHARGNFHGVEPLSPSFPGNEIHKILEDALKSRATLNTLPDLPILIGGTPQMKVIRDRIFRVADKDVTVLITGETGTGKEIIARAIHYFSHRRGGPLIKISCGNLPDQLLESEVFGFQKGAFTDAHRNKPGRLELAHNGTLFLDEVGDLSLFLQVKFLQIFEDKSFSRLGAVDERMIDARVVAATNFELSKKVKEGQFRSDLFYRLNVVHIRTAPLRERKDDIPVLIDYFMDKYCSLLKRETVAPPGEILERFAAYHWPGNVRELENLVKRAIALRSWDFAAQQIHPCEVPSSEPESPDSATLPLDPIADYLKNGIRSLREITAAYVSGIERKAIVQVLESVGWDRRRAAQALGVSYKTICNRIRDLGINAKGG